MHVIYILMNLVRITMYICTLYAAWFTGENVSLFTETYHVVKQEEGLKGILKFHSSSLHSPITKRQHASSELSFCFFIIILVNFTHGDMCC